VTIEEVFVNLVDITQRLFTCLCLKYFLQIPWAYTASQSYIQRFLLYWICRIFWLYYYYYHNHYYHYHHHRHRHAWVMLL
jgi:hypothetical protein